MPLQIFFGFEPLRKKLDGVSSSKDHIDTEIEFCPKLRLESKGR